MKFKNLFVNFFCLLTLFIISSLLNISCNKKNQKIAEKTDSTSTHKITIGFSIDTLALERWQRDLDIFINKVRELGAETIVQNAGNSIEEQNRQLLYLLERNVDVIVVLPKDADSITDSIQKIKNKGIPVISYDRLTLNADIDLYITIDSEKVGELMGIGLMKIAKGNTWYCILGPKEDYNITLIKDGITKVLRGTPVTISHIYYTEGWNYDLSYKEALNIIKNEKIPDAFVCGNDAVAASVISALSKYYPDTHIPICGQDADIAACQYIVQGKQDFTIYKPIIKLAEIAAEYAVALARGENIYSKEFEIKTINNGFGEIPGVWLEPTLADKTNLDEVIIDSGFHNRTSIYRTN